MKKVSELEAGDRVVRFLEERQGSLTPRNGCVIAVNKKIIACEIVTPDYPRTMEFDAQTGINVNGKDYGYIESTE